MPDEVTRLQSEVETLRQDVRRLENALIQRTQARPFGNLQLVRLNPPLSIPLGPDPPPHVIQTTDKAGPVATKNADSKFRIDDIKQTARDGLLQDWAHDTLIYEFDSLRFVLPQPHRIIPIVVTSAPPAGIFLCGEGRDGQVGPAAGGGTLASGPVTPLLSVAPTVNFINGVFPYGADEVLPGMHVWPTLQEGGTSAIPGVDPDIGVFLVFPVHGIGPNAFGGDPAGFSDSVLLASGETVTVQIPTDGAGRVRGVDISKTGP